MAGGFLTQVNHYDRLFDQELTSQYNLSIRINPDGLSFSVYAPFLSRFIGLESVKFTGYDGLSSNLPSEANAEAISDFLNQHPWIKNPFRQTCVIVCSQVYTMVPHVLYNEQEKKTYLSFVHQSVNPETVSAQFLNSAEAWVVYGMSQNLFHTLKPITGNAGMIHHAGAYIETVLPRYRHSQLQNPVFVNINTEFFDIVILGEGKLRYCNSFSWKTSEDVSYFLIFVLDQLGLNPENVQVLLSGDVSPDSNLFSLLYRYIRHISFIKGAEPVKGGLLLPDEAEFRFVDILNPALCAL